MKLMRNAEVCSYRYFIPETTQQIPMKFGIGMFKQKFLCQFTSFSVCLDNSLFI